MPKPPGLLRPSQEPDVIMMICTAGHVDHGKTRLVRLLTGCETDRLKVEQERGLTIELGFAPCTLGEDLCVGIVDVPGHEKFIRNMVAGVSGISMAMLVVAADDGLMPQTVEHFQIMDLLGVQRGIIAVTKTDLVLPERVVEVAEELRVFLQGTFMESAPICPLSSETGEGVFEFYETLVAAIREASPPSKGGVFRMPVERAFVQKGFGTVMTGIPVAGHIAVGDEVELIPGGQRGRVRNIQRFLRDAEEGGAGQCLALNVPGLSKEASTRGQVVCTPTYLKPVRLLHVALRAVRGLTHAIQHATQVKMHAGTSEVAAKLYLLESRVLEEEQRSLATLILEHSIAIAPGDRFILRRPSPAETVAGGEILEVSETTRRPQKAALLDKLRLRSAVRSNMHTAQVDAHLRDVAVHLLFDARHGASQIDISRGVLMTPEEVGEAVESLVRSGEVLRLDGDWFVHTECYRAAQARIGELIEGRKTDDGALSLSIAEIQKELGWPDALMAATLAEMEGSGYARVRDGKLVLGEVRQDLNEREQQVLDAVLKVYRETGFKSPRPDELPEAIGAPPEDVRRMLAYLCDAGELVRLSKNVVLSSEALRKAQDLVVNIIQRDGELNSGDFKREIDSTRKYALAILDYFDARRITTRAESMRRLASNYQERLL